MECQGSKGKSANLLIQLGFCIHMICSACYQSHTDTHADIHIYTHTGTHIIDVYTHIYTNTKIHTNDFFLSVRYTTCTHTHTHRQTHTHTHCHPLELSCPIYRSHARLVLCDTVLFHFFRPFEQISEGDLAGEFRHIIGRIYKPIKSTFWTASLELFCGYY